MIPLEWFPLGVALVFAFLLGSTPFGLIFARIFGGVADVRAHGSGNIGATNVTRVAGKGAGALTFLFDAGKGMLPVVLVTSAEAQALWWPALGHALLGPDALLPATLSDGFGWQMGLAALLGHCFSPWLRFKGGKGVATGFGALLGCAPASAAVGICVFALVFLRTRIGSLASISAVTALTVSYFILGTPVIEAWPGGAMVWLVLIRHSANLDALLQGRERAFG